MTAQDRYLRALADALYFEQSGNRPNITSHYYRQVARALADVAYEMRVEAGEAVAW